MTKAGKRSDFFPQERFGVILKENTSRNTILLIAVVSLGYFTYIPALLQFFFLNYAQLFSVAIQVDLLRNTFM